MSESQDKDVIPAGEPNPEKLLSMIKIVFWGCLTGLLLAIYLWGKFRA